MSFLTNIRYQLTGPEWPEILVAREFAKKGWHVYRNFNVYDPKNNEYAEIDILAIAHDGLIMAEIKSYKGVWESLDFEEKPKWRKKGHYRKSKSPVWQVKRSRLALINTLRHDFPTIKSNIIKATHTFVYLDRGHINNATDSAVLKAWQDMKVSVLPLASCKDAPLASKPAAAPFQEWVVHYQRHFRWRWYFKVLRKFNLLDAHLVNLQAQWIKKRKA